MFFSDTFLWMQRIQVKFWVFRCFLKLRHSNEYSQWSPSASRRRGEEADEEECQIKKSNNNIFGIFLHRHLVLFKFRLSLLLLLVLVYSSLTPSSKSYTVCPRRQAASTDAHQCYRLGETFYWHSTSWDFQVRWTCLYIKGLMLFLYEFIRLHAGK